MQKQYEDLLEEARKLLGGECDFIANQANLAALLYCRIPYVNWVGFYRVVGEELLLGPFQGKPACARIPFGKGVCGKAVKARKTLIVPDVHLFEGYIACDPETESEIVVPLVEGERVIGVLDVDSPLRDRFTEEDKIGLEALVSYLVEVSDTGFVERD